MLEGALRSSPGLLHVCNFAKYDTSKPNPRLRKSNAVLHVWRLDTMLSHVLDVGDQVGTALLHQIQILLEPGFDSYPDTAWIPVWIPGFFKPFALLKRRTTDTRDVRRLPPIVASRYSFAGVCPATILGACADEPGSASNEAEIQQPKVKRNEHKVQTAPVRLRSTYDKPEELTSFLPLCQAHSHDHLTRSVPGSSPFRPHPSAPTGHHQTEPHRRGPREDVSPRSCGVSGLSPSKRSQRSRASIHLETWTFDEPQRR